MKCLSFLLMLALVISCGNNSQKEFQNDYSMGSQLTPAIVSEQMIPQQVPKQLQHQEPDKKKIIKDGDIQLEVNNLKHAKQSIDSLINRFNAYYAEESFNNFDYDQSINLTVRVPSKHFDLFITNLESGIGKISSKKINARDVTEEFIDLETRLKNKQSYLIRYRELLTRAKSIKEILEIEEKVRLIEEEIESTKGRLKYLNDQVSYSTLKLRLYSKIEFRYEPRHRDNFFERLKQSLSKGWFGFVDFMLFMVKIWPFWLLLTLAIYLWKKFKNRNR